MLRAIVICPDVAMNKRLDASLSEIGSVTVTRVMNHYPGQQELLRFLRAHGPQVLFLSTESMVHAAEIVREIEKHIPGVQVIAIGGACEPQLLLELMRVGIREYASDPFDKIVLGETLLRVRAALDARPALIESTDNVFSFLPSKAGVGASTLALNISVALSNQPNSSVLLSDFNSGMMRFMLKLDDGYCVTDAAEHALHMDEELWPQMVRKIEKPTFCMPAN